MPQTAHCAVPHRGTCGRRSRQRQAGRRRQVRAGHRHALDETQRAAVRLHCESEDFLALGIRDIGRDALRALAEARGATTEFLRHYRRYAQVAAKRKATGPRQAQSRYEQLGRDLTAAEEAYTAADAELGAARSELEELEREQIRLEARREALRRDPAMRDARELDLRHQDARQRDETAREREQALDRLTGELTRRSAKASEAAHRASAAENELNAALDTAAAAAAAARCAPDHSEAIQGWREDLPRARRAAHEVAERQAGAVGHLERLLADVAARSSAVEAARAEVDRLTAEIHVAADRVAAVEQAAATRAAELADAYRAYQAGLTELRVDDPDELIELVMEWAATGDGENPARQVIDDAARPAVDALGRQGAELSARRDTFATTAAELTAEIGRLEAAATTPPSAAYPGSAGPCRPAGSAAMEGDRFRVRTSPKNTGRAWRPRWRRRGSSTRGSLPTVISSRATLFWSAGVTRSPGRPAAPCWCRRSTPATRRPPPCRKPPSAAPCPRSAWARAPGLPG